MSFEFFMRLVGMILLAFAGLQFGFRLSEITGEPPEMWSLVSALIGALFGLILTPYLTTRPARAPASSTLMTVTGSRSSPGSGRRPRGSTVARARPGHAF